MFKRYLHSDMSEKAKAILQKHIVLVIWFIICCWIQLPAEARVYTANLSGNYNDKTLWIPEYPGNIIQNTDTVIINNDVRLTSDLVIKGTLLIRRFGSLQGNKNLVVLPEGFLLNSGIIITDGVVNQGTVYNRHIVEISADLINSGQIYNTESIVVGNITDNTGLLTGNGGNIISNKRFVNSQGGTVKGNIDVCSNNFINAQDGTIDSTSLSFCGQRIFNNIYLSAHLRKDNIELRLNNINQENYRQFQVERSVDGMHFQTIATITKEELNSYSLPFTYVDFETVRTPSIYYRIKATTEENTETYFPEVEVGNIFSSKSNNSQGF
ncbi:MAG: hypothetical protein KatS3mg031_0023 [Chitinophagales bacterium]|nr:MAG: hypothetical protein KatS3mg031_0023 [Chitinophagales bacterium]